MSQPEHHIASHTTGPESAPQEAARLGPHERLIGVLISPTETFQDINRKPTWLAPLVISIVVASASLFFVNWRINPDWNRLTRQMMKEQMSALGGQTPSEDVIQQQVRVNEIIGRFLPAFPVVGTPFFYLVLAGIFTLGLLVMQAQTTFKKILSVVSWTFCGITLVAGLVNSASLMVRDEQSLASMNPFDPGTISATNLSVLLSADASAPVKVLAGALDVFNIWAALLLTAGLAAIGGTRKMTKGKTGVLVFGLWGLWVVIRVGIAVAFGR